MASFCGGTFSAILLMLFAPLLANLAVAFESAEYFALMVCGLTAIAAFAGKGNIIKAMLMTSLGIALSTVGESALFNAPRFTLGISDLQSGVYFITLVMGLFAIPETFFLILGRIKAGAKSHEPEPAMTALRMSLAEAKEIAPVIARQSVMGFLIWRDARRGCDDASFLAYAFERNIAPADKRAEFGHGSIRGLAAPEAANNAACTGSFVPMLTLGIPGSGTTAVLLGALIALNITPGPQLINEHPAVFWSVIISMYIGN